MDTRLAQLFHDDRTDHAAVPPVRTPEYLALRERDRQRREAADAILTSISDPDGADLYHVAWLFNHGDTPAEARHAHELAVRSAALGYSPALWLSAAAFDRWCMYRGLPQRFGTQIVPDGVRHRVWDTDPSTTDEERARFNVPPLAEQQRRAAQLSMSEPQPDLSLAPEWLREAIPRWRA
jgi:hypothetical protein